MRHQFEKPCFTRIGLVEVETHEISCAVEIEPDESTGDARFYIARVFVEGATAGGKLRWFELSDANPLKAQITSYAYTYCSDALHDLWEDWLADHPRARELRSDAEREHRTHGGMH